LRWGQPAGRCDCCSAFRLHYAPPRAFRNAATPFAATIVFIAALHFRHFADSEPLPLHFADFGCRHWPFLITPPEPFHCRDVSLPLLPLPLPPTPFSLRRH